MTANDQVEELQGPYGPIVISEEILHRIWAHQDFAKRNLTTRSGKTLEIRFPGSWNRAGGPDFRNARLVLDGVVTEGDVEIHFREREWFDHRHHSNPEFSRVILHVVLFPPDSEARPNDPGHWPRECFVWLPHLDRDLEAYADEIAYSLLGSHVEQELLDALSKQTPEERRERVASAARQRWKRKCARARTVLDEVEWNEACHRLVMEGLGLSRNRAPMLRTARRFPLDDWCREDSEKRVAQAIHAENGWRLSGIRPSNQPTRRLERYANLCRLIPDWPARLADILGELESPVPDPLPTSTFAFRRSSGLPALGRRIENEIFSGAIGTQRLRTLMVDYLLPLAEGHLGQDLAAFGFHWHPGDVSGQVERMIRLAGVTEPRKIPACNGWNQGMLQLLAEQAAIG